MAETGVSSCGECGHPNPAGNRFCGGCGAALPLTCAACGSANPASNRFCGACGGQLAAAAAGKPAPSGPAPLRDVPGPGATAPMSVDGPEHERRVVTALFCDLVEFTPLTERLDPEDVREIQGLYFGLVSREIVRFGGTIEKYAGDAVLALFGVPTAHEDDAERAVRCGLAMQEVVRSAATEAGERWSAGLAVRVGIDTGDVVSGVWDTGGRQEHSVSGDTVNTAARIQASGKAGEVLVGEETMWLARWGIQFGERRDVVLKGKAGTTAVYPALAVRDDPGTRWEKSDRVPLVGRDEELTLLTSVWAKVLKESRPQLMTIMGDPGIGKSRLVAEFEGQALAEARVLHGRCLPYGEVLGYSALAAMLNEAAGISLSDDVATARGKLQELTTGLMRETQAAWDPDEITQHLALLIGLETGSESAPAADQHALHVSVRRFVEALARSGPVCLMFEDLHWADDALLDLIEFVASHVHDASLLILTQARPDLLEKRPSWGRGVRAFTSVTLEALDGSHGDQLVRELCREHGLSEQIAEQIGRAAAGNPLFAEELVATIAERGGGEAIPSAIKALISARLDSLPVEERRVLQRAAVVGRIFWDGVLEVFGATNDLTGRLDALEQKDLIRGQMRSQLHGAREYAFKHDLIRDVAYERLSRADRRAFHGLVADWVEAQSGERLEEYLDLLAHHTIQAGQSDRGLRYLMRAAERARRAAAHREEAALLQQAIEIAEELGYVDLVAELHAKRGAAFFRIGMWPQSRAEMEDALARLASDRVERRAEILVDLSIACFWCLDQPSSRRYAGEALPLAEQAGRDDLAAGANGAIAAALGADGDVVSAVQEFRRAVSRARGTDTAPVAHALQQSSIFLYHLAEYPEGVERSREAVQIAHTVNDRFLLTYALPHLALNLAGSGRYAEAMSVFERQRQIGRDQGIHTFLARGIAMSAGMHLDLFNLDRAEELQQEARELALSAQFPPTIVSAGIDLLFTYARRGDVPKAEQLLPAVAEAVAGASGWHGWLWAIRVAEARAEIALARGDWPEALRQAETTISLAHAKRRLKYEASGLRNRAAALTQLGRKNEAAADLHAALALVRPCGDPVMLLHAAMVLLAVDGDDELLGEATRTAQNIAAALPDQEMLRCFVSAEPVRSLIGTAGLSLPATGQ